MKRLSYIIIFITFVSAFISCEHVLCVDGAWDPMELDKAHVNFPSEGGQNTVSVLNYTLWWIVGGYTSVNEIGDQQMQSGNAFTTFSISQE